ncbi:LacI family DNA-binding transcriptional regulator [Lipingzhangella sp. LS1_29]|uniref:LacI family DNA-binding transcriptional regulator n=1 Tax=Lipingzhangella rawalii TaxID=2055835 RepID=A0ABU2H1X3_9ACTN|nr:LacI family DNA-binding transcriptional regulator [Lipingzhangella rawalii]MDS1269288.1 LacI family DNA-binding transcriptional regulator [Lipingzhangella rawalii]
MSTGTAGLAEIAGHAGVSAATVSRVLNGRPGVSPSTRRAVLRSVDVLGYERPQRLQPARAGLVGLIVPELDNPIFPAYAQCVESMLMQRGYACVLCTQEPGGVTEDDYTELLLERGVCGIVYVYGKHADSHADLDRYRRLLDQGLPLALIGGVAPEAQGADRIAAPLIRNDDARSIELGVQHLAALGHRRIGIALGPHRFVPVIHKRAGYLDGMRRAVGAEPPQEWCRHELHTLEGGHAATRELLAAGCTAALCASDTMAVGAIRAAREAGYRVPEDFSVVGFDDSPLMAYVDPPLTTIRQPVREMSRAAVASLVADLDSSEGCQRELLFHPELVVRSSTAPVPSWL